MLADEFAKLGSEVGYPFRIVRSPSFIALLKLCREADILFQNHPSLSLGFPGLLVRVPAVTLHQTWLSDGSGRAEFMASIKRLFILRSRNLVNSKALSKRDLYSNALFDF